MTSNEDISAVFKDFLMIFFSRERWRSTLSEKQHRGTQKSNKNNKSNKDNKNSVFLISPQDFMIRPRGVGVVWLPKFCGGLGGPMGSICRPNDRIVRKLSAGQNRPWKFWVWDFWSKMTIFFDFPKMCLKCHIWVFYRFRTLSRPQMADFRPYMTFPTTSGQYMKNKKIGFLGNFCNFGIIGRYM